MTVIGGFRSDLSITRKTSGKGRTIRNPGRGDRKLPVHEFFFSQSWLQEFFFPFGRSARIFFSIFFNYVM